MTSYTIMMTSYTVMMMSYSTVGLLTVLVAVTGGEYQLNITMKDVVPEKPDDLVCIAKQLDPAESYIVKFTPHASASTAHHMMVYGCQMPAHETMGEAWRCPDADGKGVHSVCGQGQRQIYFAWALDAPEFTLPDGVGFRVSGDTGINYLVIQLHYAKRFPDGVTDNSGVTLDITNTRPPQQAGYIVIGTWGSIPPHQPAYHMESACVYHRNYTIYPIGYRTHAHNLGVVTSGYRVRGGQWEQIGRMSPQLPQTFYPVSTPGMEVRPGDLLAGRCTMNSMGRLRPTRIGQHNHDEMCNFYIMYSTQHQAQLSTDYCFQDADTFRWAHQFPDDVIPHLASSLDGIPGAAEVRDKFNMKPR